jgi:hypothetical protein
MKFKLEIDLDAVGTYPEIEAAISQSLQLYHDAISLGGVPANEDEGIIRNDEGHTVGTWEVTDDKPVDPIERMYDEAFEDDGTDAACDEFVPTVALSALCDACGEPYNDHSTAAKGSH